MSQWNRPPSGSKRKSEFMDPERLENYHLPLSQQSNISQSSEADSSPHSYQEGQTLKTISTFPPLTLQSRIPTDVVETRIDASFHSSPSKMRLPIPSATSSATLTLPPIALSSPGSASYTPQSGNLPPKSGTDYLTIQLLQRENTDLASAYTQAQTHIADLDTMFQASRVENGKLAKERQRLTGKMEFLEAQLDEVEQSIQQSQEHTAAKDAQYSRIVDLSTRLQNEWSFEKKSMQSVISYLTNEVDGLRKAYVGPAKVTNLLPSPVEDNSNETENNPNTTAESSSHELIAEMKALRLANARMKDALAEVRGDNEKLAECVEKLGSVEKDIRTHLRKVESARGSLNLFDGEGTTAKDWSTSGRLLASGSDDQHLNIHTYQSDSSVAPFALTTTVATGHTANIFSVKFMPHSNDCTLVTAAGDAEVRVFDIEYSGRSADPSMGPSMATAGRGQRFQNMYRGVRYLSDGNTNARIYRSHADRVKRIVTESSPNLFLTCSEDGEVRQFDLRLPSSSYPPPKGGRGFLAHRADHDNTNVPPPLISYKRFNLDLNTISCSASQPHYIALGGAHLHCFLHDRRMLGRNMDEEHGNPGRASPANSMSSQENEMMGQATRCVRKFAPEGRKKMRRTDNGHITACKISDANPNEMIASWSGDHIYSFDLIRSPDASEGERRKNDSTSLSGKGKGKVRESGDRKRKRMKQGSTTSLEVGINSAKSRRAKERLSEDSDLALRVRYENGQSEDIAVGDAVPSLPSSIVEEARESVLSESQKRSLKIAKSLVKIRRLMFSLEASGGTSASSESANHNPSFTAALGLAATCLPEMDEISRSWRYPVNPLYEDIVLQQTLRANRDSSRRFVQAAGTLARLLGGKIQTASPLPSPALDLFQEIGAVPHEGPVPSDREIFHYDFLKAIILWLEGGPQALLQGFQPPPNQRNYNPRFPVPDGAELPAIDEWLIPYLLGLATGSAVPNLDASRFVRDEARKIFETDTAAIIAFASAIKMPLEDLSSMIVPVPENADDGPRSYAQDKKTATKYWAFKVGRALLMNAGEGVNFQFVDTAFGGLGATQTEEETVQEDIDLDEEEQVVEGVSLVKRSGEVSPSRRAAASPEETMGSSVTGDGMAVDASPDASVRASGSDIDIEDAGSDADVILIDDLHNEIAEHMADEDANEDGEDHDDVDDGDSDADDDDDDGDITAEERQFMFQSASARGKLREKVEKDVPCYSHSRQYRGHCNVKTVKDANFFGLQDEYVVSGSDGGHLFIWDKKTSALVNILEGDNEVVNVVQGHPYEPVLAVSGIDHTIKIFSPDHRAHEDAQAGVNISSATNGSSGFSSISGRRRFGRESDNEDRPREEGLTSRKRMHQSYQIISQNDMQRKGGMRDAYITRGMLAQLAARLRARQGGAGDLGGGVVLGEDGEAVLVDDNCSIM